MTSFQRLLLVTILATFALVVIGGIVRATGSGLGCPDWPTCHGRLIPSSDKHTIIEYSHRTAAFVVGLLFLAVTFFTFKTERRRPLVFWLAFTAGVLLLAQIILGGITVKKELPAGIVAAHLGTAMAFIGVMIVTLTISLMRARGRSVPRFATDDAFNRLAIVTAGAAFATLVLGSYISGTDASLACHGWPLCNGSVFPGGGSAVGLHFLHRLLAGLLGILLLALIYLAFEQRRRQPLLVALTLASGVAYLAQALVGAANIWTDLAAGVVVTHLSLAALLWCSTVLISALAFYLPGREADEPAAAAKRNERTAQWVR
ncbi:MAG TPA: COX15/CtaA family protein [Dehalococcoidia bacterium]|nr:COX15/CtaA family protein [Dehalococcoidia bacterium]